MASLIARIKHKCKPKLYLHIGMPKTGTSAIQGMLFDNEDALESSGYCYPKMTQGGPSDFAYAHHTLGRAALKQEEESWKILRDELKKKGRRSIIISSESFSNCRQHQQIEWIKSFLTDYQIKVIVYLRRQDEFLQSLYQTRVSYGDLTSSFDEFFSTTMALQEKTQSLNYYDLASTLWANQFGPKNIIVRVYEKSQLYNNNLLQDFLHTVGIKKTKAFNLDVSNNNLSFNAYLLEMYRKIKTVFPEDKDLLEEVRRNLRSRNVRNEFTGNNIISAAQSAHLMNTVADTNALLANELLGRKDGILFQTPELDSSATETPLKVKDVEIIEFLQTFNTQASEQYSASIPST